jgi:hypothetical protein
MALELLECQMTFHEVACGAAGYNVINRVGTIRVNTIDSAAEVDSTVFARRTLDEQLMVIGQFHALLFWLVEMSSKDDGLLRFQVDVIIIQMQMCSDTPDVCQEFVEFLGTFHVIATGACRHSISCCVPNRIIHTINAT